MVTQTMQRGLLSGDTETQWPAQTLRPGFECHCKIGCLSAALRRADPPSKESSSRSLGHRVRSPVIILFPSVPAAAMLDIRAVGAGLTLVLCSGSLQYCNSVAAAALASVHSTRVKLAPAARLSNHGCCTEGNNIITGLRTG
jgi:hypothetical protein